LVEEMGLEARSKGRQGSYCPRLRLLVGRLLLQGRDEIVQRDRGSVAFFALADSHRA
jgi:hypothetical protein